MHELLPVLLQGGVYGGNYVVAGDGFLVLLPVLVGLLNLVAGVAEVDVVSLLSAKLRFTGRLNAGHAGVVSAAVFAGMAVYVGLVHLGYVSKEVSASIEGVVPDAPDLPFEARETVFYFVKAHISFGRDHAHHGDGLKAYGRAPAAVFLEFSPDEFRRHVQNRGKGQGVEGLNLPGAHKDVVGHLVSNQDVPVAVVDDPAGGIDGLVDGGIAVCVLFVAVYHLQGKDFCQQYKRRYAKADK